MRVLILGCSSIASRRVIPALKSIPCIDGIDIASRHKSDAAPNLISEDGTVYDSIEVALAESAAEIVYVSLENSAHTDAIKAALETGRHVIADKPATLNLKDAERLVTLADSKNVIFAEATVFLDHPRIADLSAIPRGLNQPYRIHACFSFPPLPKDNFRYDPNGGGAINDLGPYAAATCRYFFKTDPLEMTCCALSHSDDKKVETAFSVTAVYAGGGIFSGTFGFDTEYQNWIQGTGHGLAIRLDRVFTPPPDMALEIEIRRNNTFETITSTPGDCFTAMFNRVLNGIETNASAEFHSALLQDARFCDGLRSHIKESV
jgi:NDP-hexose-3-ketoreductase